VGEKKEPGKGGHGSTEANKDNDTSMSVEENVVKGGGNAITLRLNRGRIFEKGEKHYA